MTWIATERTIGTVLSTVITDDESPAARRHICTISVSADNPAAIEKMRARARLICQAEAMLTELKGFQIDFCSTACINLDDQKHFEECERARAIIAAAEYDTVDRADIGHEE